MRLLLKLLCMLAIMAHPSHATSVSEKLKDPVLEARARALSAQVKCPSCQGQCIDDSNARLARDLRVFIRQALQNGAKDEDILAALLERFGPSVLFEPRWELSTFFLWASPFLFLLCMSLMWGYKRRARL